MDVLFILLSFQDDGHNDSNNTGCGFSLDIFLN